jgi:mevalonate kinase
MHLVIANSGITASTSEVVSEVRRLREKNPQKFKTIFNKYEMLAKNAKEALLKGDIDSIGEYMNQNQQLLREIGVSGPINEKLIKIAIENGALGAKLTGTGQGGLIIALTANKESQNTIANAIEQEGYDAWKTMIG